MMFSYVLRCMSTIGLVIGAMCRLARHLDRARMGYRRGWYLDRQVHIELLLH
jgi:hypothetical protein